MHSGLSDKAPPPADEEDDDGDDGDDCEVLVLLAVVLVILLCYRLRCVLVFVLCALLDYIFRNRQLIRKCTTTAATGGYSYDNNIIHIVRRVSVEYKAEKSVRRPTSSFVFTRRRRKQEKDPKCCNSCEATTTSTRSSIEFA